MNNKYVPIESRQFPGWYVIPGYPNNLANKKGEILNIRTRKYSKGGDAGRYLKVKVFRGTDEFPTLQYAHELVCRAFQGPRPDRAIVSHKDSNKKNNVWTNLEWDTQSNNVKIMYAERRRMAMENMSAWGQWDGELNIALEFLDDSVARIAMQSSNLSAVAYDPAFAVLEVHFKNGTAYHYYDVPSEIYLGLVHASSAGKYLNEAIKGKFKYSKI